MPTVGWILEDSIDRFWEGRGEPLPAPPVFTCSQCGNQFSRGEDLRGHYAAAHPLQLPLLHLRGVPLPREAVVRTPVRPIDLDVIQATRCQVQLDTGPWRAFSEAEFKSRFADATNSTWNIRLMNERPVDGSHVQEEYHVRFRIPADTALDRIDQDFIQTLARNEIGHSDLERFAANLGADGPEREYGGALGDYALGVLLKEWQTPPKSQIRFDEFAAKMKLALNVLEHFARPVALAVVGAVRFNLNDFHNYGVQTAPELREGVRFFRELLTDSPVAARASPRGRATPICPIDRVTQRLLVACSRLSTGGALPPTEFYALQHLLTSGAPTSEQDLTKAHVLCAESSIRSGRDDEAIRHLQAVRFDATTREWARSRLHVLDDHDN